MGYFLGVDVGGTKSHAVITDEAGQIAGVGRSGAGNWESVGYHGLTQTLQTIVKQACTESGITAQQIAGAGFGIAGYDWPSQLEQHQAALAPLQLECPISIVNDAALGIPASTSEGWGVSVASGTGCNCRGWNRDRSRHGRAVGGYGVWSDEAAGGYDILYRAMRAISFEWTKRGPPTALTTAFLEKSGARSLGEMIEGIYLDRYRFDPDYVMLVFEVAKQDDPQALEVMRWAGRQLAHMAAGVVRQIGVEAIEFELVQIGSIFNGHPLIAEQMNESIRSIAPGAKIIRLDVPPVLGSILLGMELAMGKSAYRARENIRQQISKVNL